MLKKDFKDMKLMECCSIMPNIEFNRKLWLIIKREIYGNERQYSNKEDLCCK